MSRFLSVCLLLTLASPSINALTLTFAYENKPQPPYYLGDANQVFAEKPGIAVEMLQKLDQNMDELEIKFVRMPWKRALYSLKSNRVDGIFNASYKPERLDFGRYPTKDAKQNGPIDSDRRITRISYSLYCLDSFAFNWQGDWQMLKGQLVGAPLGYSIVGDLQKQGIEVEESSSTQSNLLMLMTKRINLVALQTISADSILSAQVNQKQTSSAQQNYGAIKKLSPALVSKDYYLMLSHGFVRQYPQLAQKIWDEVKRIRVQHSDSLYRAYQD